MFLVSEKRKSKYLPLQFNIINRSFELFNVSLRFFISINDRHLQGVLDKEV